MDKNKTLLPCQRCHAQCCKAVKRLPYQGETEPGLFERLLIGAFPDLEEPGDQGLFRRPYVAEWIIPGEAESCPAHRTDGLCDIHIIRPRACRLFPRNSDGSFHPFCPHPDLVPGEQLPEPEFSTELAKLDSLLLNLIHRGKAGLAGKIIGEEKFFHPPLLYNGFLVAIWLIAGVDPKQAVDGQKEVLGKYMEKGMENLTFLIPDTDCEISGPAEGFLANLEWLEYRIVQEDLVNHILKGLEDNGILLMRNR